MIRISEAGLKNIDSYKKKSVYINYYLKLKGLSHEKLFRQILCKNASEIRWAWWKKWKNSFSTLILAFISNSSQLMVLKKWDCVHNSSLSFWEDVHNLSLRYVEEVHNSSLKKWDCPELVTETARLSRTRHWNFETSGQSRCFSDKFWTVSLFQWRVVDILHISQWQVVDILPKTQWRVVDTVSFFQCH